jgi:hypothetical protein
VEETETPLITQETEAIDSWPKANVAPSGRESSDFQNATASPVHNIALYEMKK